MLDQRLVLFPEPETTAGACRRCANRASYRSAVVALFEADHAALHSARSTFDYLVAIGACCHLCEHPSYVALLIYHLRQDGVVERVARGRYRYRVSDATTTDFVSASAGARSLLDGEMFTVWGRDGEIHPGQ